MASSVLAADSQRRTIDLPTYSSHYSGMTKILRLKHIARTFPKLQSEAMNLLAKEVTAGFSTELYTELCELARTYGMNDTLVFDEEWVRKAAQEKRRRVEAVSTDLSHAKSSSNKEAIRRGHMELGMLYMEHYELLEAIKEFNRTRDYAGKAEHYIETSFKIAVCYMDLGMFMQAQSAVNKVSESTEPLQAKAQVKALQGLCSMLDGSYSAAANAFLETDSSVLGGSSFSNVIATRDVALYGCLCALATMDPPKMKRLVLDSKTIKTSLEQVPWARSLVQSFCSSAFGECLSLLHAKEEEMKLDMYLAPHVQALFKHIFTRTLIQYCHPYISLDMTRMSGALGMPLNKLESELATLIASDKMPFRIDSAAHQLHRKVQDDRDVAIEKVTMLNDLHATSIRQGILRLSLMQHSFSVLSSKTERAGYIDGRGGMGPEDTGLDMDMNIEGMDEYDMSEGGSD